MPRLRHSFGGHWSTRLTERARPIERNRIGIAGVKKLILWGVGVLLVQVAGASSDAQFRAFWVTAFGPGFWTPGQADQLLTQTRAANLNALMVQVGRRGDAFYNDSFQPRSEEPNFQPGFDALQYLIDSAHGLTPRLEIHAWINTLVMANANALPKDPQHVFNLHGPHTADNWFTQRLDGLETSASSYFLDAGHPEAAQYVVRMYAWLVSNYEVDGIHLDFIRYPETNVAGADWGYNPTAVARFNQELGRSGIPSPSDPDWIGWRREQVTNLVRKIYLTVTALNPKVKVSAATIAWGAGPRSAEEYYASGAAYTRVLQDWFGWLKEGILDLNVPMNYDRESSTRQAQWFRDWISFETAHQFNRHVVIGQGSFLNAIADTLRQIRLALSRALGVCGFSYQTSNNENKPFSEMVRALTQPSEYDPESVPVFATAASVPGMPWKENPTRGHLMGWVSPARVTEVTVSGPETRTLKSDGRGWFGTVDLPPGSYTIKVGAEQQSVEVSAGSVSAVTFPASILLPVIASDGNRFTGIAISNLSDTEVNLQARHFSSGVARTLRLAPRTQLARLASEIFEPGLEGGWVEIEKRGGISGFFQIGDYDGTFLDGGTEALRASSRTVFERLDGNLYVINPGPEAIDVRFTHYADSGQLLSSDGFWLASKERKVVRPSSREGYLDLRAGGEIVAFLWRQTAQAAAGSPGLRPSRSGRLYSAHFAHGELGGIRTFSRVALINAGERTALVSYRLTDDDGAAIARGSLSIGPHQRVEADGSTILGISDPESRVPAVVGSLVLEGTQDVAGVITFGDAARGRFETSMPLAERAGTRYVFNHLANAGSFFTGLGILNPGLSSTEILVQVYQSSGTRSGEKRFALGPGQRLSRLLKELVPETSTQVGGYLILSSPKEFVCFMLFATDSLSFLSALPGN